MVVDVVLVTEAGCGRESETPGEGDGRRLRHQLHIALEVGLRREIGNFHRLQGSDLQDGVGNH